MNHIRKRTLKVTTTRFFDTANKAFNLNVDDDCDDFSPESSPTPSINPTLNPTLNPTYSEKKITASDDEAQSFFGYSSSLSNDLSIIGAPFADSSAGRSYLFNLDGTAVAKLTPGDDEVQDNKFGIIWFQSMKRL